MMPIELKLRVPSNQDAEFRLHGALRSFTYSHPTLDAFQLGTATTKRQTRPSGPALTKIEPPEAWTEKATDWQTTFSVDELESLMQADKAYWVLSIIRQVEFDLIDGVCSVVLIDGTTVEQDLHSEADKSRTPKGFAARLLQLLSDGLTGYHDLVSRHGVSVLEGALQAAFYKERNVTSFHLDCEKQAYLQTLKLRGFMRAELIDLLRRFVLPDLKASLPSSYGLWNLECKIEAVRPHLCPRAQITRAQTKAKLNRKAGTVARVLNQELKAKSTDMEEWCLKSACRGSYVMATDKTPCNASDQHKNFAICTYGLLTKSGDLNEKSLDSDGSAGSSPSDSLGARPTASSASSVDGEHEIIDANGYPLSVAPHEYSSSSLPWTPPEMIPGSALRTFSDSNKQKYQRCQDSIRTLRKSLELLQAQHRRLLASELRVAAEEQKTVYLQDEFGASPCKMPIRRKPPSGLRNTLMKSSRKIYKDAPDPQTTRGRLVKKTKLSAPLSPKSRNASAAPFPRRGRSMTQSSKIQNVDTCTSTFLETVGSSFGQSSVDRLKARSLARAPVVLEAPGPGTCQITFAALNALDEDEDESPAVECAPCDMEWSSDEPELDSGSDSPSSSDPEREAEAQADDGEPVMAYEESEDVYAAITEEEDELEPDADWLSLPASSFYMTDSDVYKDRGHPLIEPPEEPLPPTEEEAQLLVSLLSAKAFED